MVRGRTIGLVTMGTPGTGAAFCPMTAVLLGEPECDKSFRGGDSGWPIRHWHEVGYRGTHQCRLARAMAFVADVKAEGTKVANRLLPARFGPSASHVG